MGRENKICFTDSQGNALFTIPDGGMIKLAYGNGDETMLSAAIRITTTQRLTAFYTLLPTLQNVWRGTVSVMPLLKNSA